MLKERKKKKKKCNSIQFNIYSIQLHLFFCKIKTSMIIITFPYLYIIYGIIIILVCLSICLAQSYDSEKVLHYLCTLCAICAIYVPIFLKYHSSWTIFADALVSIFSAVTGFLFALKIVELAFTYSWAKQKQITVKQILMDFSTFPKYKYEQEPPSIK